MKKIYFSLLILMTLQAVSGQDKIITVRHDTIHCQILSVSPTRINYKQRTPQGHNVRKYIPTEQVLEYKRTSQLSEFNPYYQTGMQKTKPERCWMLGIHSGRSLLLASTTKEEQELINAGKPKVQVDNYIKQLKRGWSFGGDVYYMLSDNFGLGAKYSLLFSSAQQDFTIKYYPSNIFSTISIYSYMYLNMNIMEKMYINYVAPSVIFRQWLDENRKFQLIETVSVGYVHYRDELRQKQGFIMNNVLAKGSTWGVSTGLSGDYYYLPWLSIGVNANLMYANLKKVKITNKQFTQIVKFDKKDYLNFSRFDYSLSIRFHF